MDQKVVKLTVSSLAAYLTELNKLLSGGAENGALAIETGGRVGPVGTESPSVSLDVKPTPAYAETTTLPFISKPPITVGEPAAPVAPAYTEVTTLPFISKPPVTVGEPVAPVAPAPPAPAPPATQVELDSEGLPHDIRIHASSKATYLKAAAGKPAGSWKLKRSVDPALVLQVKTELRGGAPVTPVPTITLEPEVTNTITLPPGTPTVAPATPATPAPAPALPAYGTIVDWGTLVTAVVTSSVDQNAARIEADNACIAIGIPSLGELQSPQNVSRIPVVAHMIGLTAAPPVS